MEQALSRVDYVEEGKQFEPQDLLPLIRAHQELINQWLMYSEDKRTSGGWYITEAGDVGLVDNPDSIMRFASNRRGGC